MPMLEIDDAPHIEIFLGFNLIFFHQLKLQYILFFRFDSLVPTEKYNETTNSCSSESSMQGSKILTPVTLFDICFREMLDWDV